MYVNKNRNDDMNAYSGSILSYTLYLKINFPDVEIFFVDNLQEFDSIEIRPF